MLSKKLAKTGENELDFYLIELKEPDTREYAVYIILTNIIIGVYSCYNKN
jgi:hypothetical protein